MSIEFTDIKPHIGAIAHVDREALKDADVARRIRAKVEERGVVVFPRLGLTDEEQLAFTELLGERVNFTRTVPGGDESAAGVYTVTLDPKINKEPEYVLGTFFWHMDGITVDMPPPFASVLSARKTSEKGGQTEFASTYAAYEQLPDDEKADLEGVRVVHSVAAAVREVMDASELDPRRSLSKEHPLVWAHDNGRKSLLIGYTADTVVDRSRAEGRALLARLLEWTAQPDFTYRHKWEEGDLVIWDNTGALHRVIPYDAASGRRMHRTSIAGAESVG